MSRLADQIREAIEVFAVLTMPPALIGGLALAAHKVVRATRDVDFLIDADDADRVHDMVIRLGYKCVHRSADAANYLRGDEGLDFLYAHRPEARRLLAEAGHRDSALGRLRVVSVEGLVGFKLQGYVNDPRRVQDLEDIRNLLRVNADQLDMREIRRYFALFDRESLLDDLLTDRR